MKAGRLSLALALVAGCGGYYEAHARGVEVVCHAVECPDVALVYEALVEFQVSVPSFDVEAPLRIDWYPPGTVVFVDCDARADETERSEGGFAFSGDHIAVVGWRNVFHELMHVAFWRVFSSGDANHAEPPGPWTDEDDEVVREARDRFEQTFL